MTKKDPDEDSVEYRFELMEKRILDLKDNYDENCDELEVMASHIREQQEITDGLFAGALEELKQLRAIVEGKP